MTNDDKYIDISCEYASQLIASYTGFSKIEKQHCLNKSSWLKVKDMLKAGSMHEVCMFLAMTPMFDVISWCQLVFGYICQSAILRQFSSVEAGDERLKVMLDIIDNESTLDAAFKNTKILRLLLAARSYSHRTMSCKDLHECICKTLAHVFKKFPDMFKCNFVKANSKAKRLRFTENDMKKYL